MGKYTKQKDGRYRTTVFSGQYTEDGKRIMKYLSARTMKELEEQVEQIHADLRDKINIIDAGTPFGDYAQHWCDTYKASKGLRTQEMYSRIINSHLTGLNDIPLDKLTRSNVQALINGKSGNPRTCEQILLTIKQICNSAINDGLIRRSPCIDIELPRHLKQERRALTADEKQAIRDADLTLRQRAFVSVLLGTGMRPAEMYALTWSDIKSDSITINKSLTFSAGGNPTVTYPKTNSSVRTIQAPDFVFKALFDYKATTDSLIVFCSEKGGYRYKDRYAKEWEILKRQIVEKLGHDTPITPYYFRHNFATQCYYSNISLLECQRLLGHSSHDMIMEIYAHLDQEKEDTRAKLNAIKF